MTLAVSCKNVFLLKPIETDFTALVFVSTVLLYANTKAICISSCLLVVSHNRSLFSRGSHFSWPFPSLFL